MTITPLLFEAFLKCPTKCWLRFTGEPPSGNAYAEWVQTENESYRAAVSKQLLVNLPADECAALCSSRREEAHYYSEETLKTAKWQFAVDIPARTELGSSRGNEAQTSPPENSQSLLPSAATIETCLHAVERIPSAGRGQPAQFVPIRFIHRNKLTKDDKLLLAFDAFVLSEMLGRAVSLGKIIHGDDHATLKVRTPALAGEVRKRLRKITALLASPAPPDLVLNRHCAECEFQARCRKLAVENRILQLTIPRASDESSQTENADVVQADSEKYQKKSVWKTFTSAVSGFEYINAAAHWDYQRHRVYARSGKAPKKPAAPRHLRRSNGRTQLAIRLGASLWCPKCKIRGKFKGPASKTVHDILFGRQSLKLRAVKYVFRTYDSIGCPQQRCLIHLMRDLNDEILDNPFDNQLKKIVTAFGVLLRPMIETVDRYGLKKHFLKKHLIGVERFYRELEKTDWQSEAALKCKDRFERNRDKLFTFLNYDGVPWNNNNAEHAVKAFARVRDNVAGGSTAKGLKEYLVLLSVCQTCKYMGVDFLDFLRSGEKDIHAFAESRRRRKRA